MPSFRVALQVSEVRAGHRPAEVVDVAAAAVRRHAHLDKPDLAVEDGLAWVTVRFSIDPTGRAEEDDRAWTVADRTAAEVDRVGVVQRVRVSRRAGRDWLIVPR